MAMVSHWAKLPGLFVLRERCAVSNRPRPFAAQRPDRIGCSSSRPTGPSGAIAQAVRRGAVVGCAGAAALRVSAGCPGAGRRESVAPAQQDALGSAGLLLLNKAEGLDEAVRQTIAERLPAVKLIWTQQAHLSLRELPGVTAQAMAGVDNLVVPQGRDRFRRSGATRHRRSA